MEDREAFTNKNIDEILDSARDPINVCFVLTVRDANGG